MFKSLFSLPMQSGTAPDWVHLIPNGSFSAIDGRGPWVCPDADALISASMSGGRIPVDVNHSTDLAAPNGAPSPAVGWIVQMQKRPDGIWDRVDWNLSGLDLLKDHAYRNISPVLTYSGESGVIKLIVRASLTNNPALPQLTALYSRQGVGAALGVAQLSAVDLELCRKMGTDPQKLLAYRRQTLAPGFGAQGSGAAMLAATRQSFGVAEGVPGLTSEQLHVARMMGANLSEVHAAQAIRDAGGNPSGPGTFGLTPVEQRLCNLLGIDYRTYAQNNGVNPENDPFVSALEGPWLNGLKSTGYSGQGLRNAAIDYIYRNRFMRDPSSDRLPDTIPNYNPHQEAARYAKPASDSGSGIPPIRMPAV
jgi:hypothetical protein